MQNPILELIDYRKSYGDTPILNIPQLSLLPGVYWVKGANGSGKSTLFKTLTGLSPYQGQILIDGMDLRREPQKCRMAVNYGEAEPLYPPFVTGQDLINLYAKTKGASAEQVDSLIQAVGVGDYYRTQVGAYSSGMLKKLSLVLAFLGSPKLIVLDEPLITIDAEAIDRVCALIARLIEKGGVSFLLSSHQLFEQKAFQIDGYLNVANGSIFQAPKP